MKTASVVLFIAACFSSLARGADPLIMFLSEGGAGGSNTSAQTVVWSTEPGVRYRLDTTTNLSSDWSIVPGYPIEAEGLAHKQAIEMQHVGGFYRATALDEQPPVVIAQYPASNGYAVGRSANLFIELMDVSGINPESVSLSVGPFGPLTQGSEGFSISNSTIFFDPGAGMYGAYGETTTATFVVADTVGNALTYTWSFRLETEPETADNLFVFGSPPAQAKGQKVRGPAATLASRYPATTLPTGKASTEWSIESVASNRIVLAYTGSVPSFAVGQLICNQTPASESEIFYRIVLSTSNDAATSRLTLFTQDRDLTNFVTHGAVSLSENSVLLEFDQKKRVIKAAAIGGTLSFPRIGFDFSGTQFGLREDGFEITLAGVTYSLGNDPDFVAVTLNEYSWWFTPRIQASLELDLLGLKSFEAILQGDISLANVVEADVVLIGVRPEITLLDLPEALEPKTVIYLGQIGIVPVFATLGFDCSLKAEADAKAQLEFDFTYRQEHNSRFGLAYGRQSGVEWVRGFTHTAPDFGGDAALTAELSFHLTLDPRLEFLVYGLAGVKAEVEPSAGIVTTLPILGGQYEGMIEADVDFVLGTAGPAFEFLDYDEGLRLSLWRGEWPLTPQILAFKTHPESKAVAPGGAVSFTCSVDAPSAPSYQWFHKGLPVPGQISRSLFIPYVNSGHAGNYFVRASAGGLTADSNPATLTVQNPTPDNTDTDGDGVPDIYETNTGIWVSLTDRGSNPNRWDTDGDGWRDGVETRTGVYVSQSNTGTDPNKADTDGDGVNDKREVELGTDPNSAPGADYMIIDLSGGPNASSYPVSYLSSVPAGGWSDVYKTTKLVMRRIPAGTFIMGSPSGELGRYSDEIQCQVTLTKDFYIGVYEVTQKQWERVMGTWPSHFNNTNYRDSRPVENVSYYEIRENPLPLINEFRKGSTISPNWPQSRQVHEDSFMGRLRAKTGLTTLDLPTESQWEYACRAGTVTALNSGYNLAGSSSDSAMNAVGRYYYNHPGGYATNRSASTDGGTAKVGSYQANAWGLYDMHGNVWEWCLDWPATYSGSVTDPSGAAWWLGRAGRGGNWSVLARNCRSAYRMMVEPSYRGQERGFRPAHTLQ